jgi:hypothetical protein
MTVMNQVFVFLIAQLSISTWSSSIGSVHAHGYLKTPRSRNFVASQDGKSFGGTASTPAVEYCPHCLNRGGPLAACGLVDNRNYDTPPNAIGGTMPTNIQGTFRMGGTIEVDIVLTAHHMGHFEFHVCPLATAGEIPTMECFKSNPVTVIRDVLYGAPTDPNYPHRAYIPPLTYPGIINDTSGTVPGTLYRYVLQLPPNLQGNLVLLQWYYLTGNSCIHPGYETYPFPVAWGGNLPGNTGYCIVNDSDGGNGTPERFWNCAEISIVSSGPIPPTTSTPISPPSAPITNPPYATPIKVPAPIAVPMKSPSAPVVAPPSVSTIPCGGGSIGNGICANPALCCSKWGYCGSTIDYCSVTAPTPVSAPVASPIVTPIKVPVTTPITAPVKIPVKTPIVSPTAPIVSSPTTPWIVSTANRCGISELDARGNCGRTCTNDSHCTGIVGSDGNVQRQWCYGVQANYCDSKPRSKYCNTTTIAQQQAQYRCGIDELESRERCGKKCTKTTDCAMGEYCWSVHANTCDC